MNILSHFLTNSILEDYQTASEETAYFNIRISKEIIGEWIRTKLPKLLAEISATNGIPEVDDGPNYLFPNYKTFDKISRRRAEAIGFTVVRQIMDSSLEDIDPYPIYPTGPVKAVTPFPAGVIGKVTATNQKDYTTNVAYDKWFSHVTRAMALIGYTLVNDKDEIERRLAVKGLPSLKYDQTAKKLPDVVRENTHSFFTTDEMTAITNDIIDELTIAIRGDVLSEAHNTLKLTIPKSVRNIHSAFKKSGKKLYVVGGAVRDAILGKTPKDFDLATDAKPDEVIDIAKKNGLRYTEVGKAFGVVVVDDMEIATFRADIGSGRRPDRVDYTDIYGDVKRRDLTINALFYDLDKNEIVDLVDGIKDLQKNKIRTVGNAIERFDEDPLRKLRAIRFTARLGAKLEKSTLDAIVADPSLNGISAERIRDEFLKSIQSAKSVKQYLTLMADIKLLHQCFPNMIWKASDFIEEKNPILLLAYLFRKSDSGTLYKQLMKLKYTNDEASAIRFLVDLTNFTADNVFKLKKAQQNTVLTDAEIIKWGKLIGKDFRKFVQFNLSVKGDDVMKLGFSGKDIGIQVSKMEADRYINEDITIPVNIGDTILTGKFKNKRTKVNTIDTDEHGMPTVNGRKVVNFRKVKDVTESVEMLPNSLNIPLEKMPQIASKNISDYITFLKSKGVRVTGKLLKVSSLKPTQQSIDKAKVLQLMKDGNMGSLTKPVIISSDGYILDGHHRIYALYNLDKSYKINVVFVHLPIRKLLNITFDYPNVFTKSISEWITDVPLNEDQFKMNPGFTFIAQKSISGLRRGGRYVIHSIDGALGKLLFMVRPVRGSTLIPVKSRSHSEFYANVLMERDTI
jgi:tRNA nucleotidyltransferase/poly(A) polymerase